MINSVLWIAAILLLLLLEAATAALVSIWFAGGALAALAATLCGLNPAWQVFIFLAVSLVCVFLLRQVAIRHIRPVQEKTNIDRLIGQEVLITQTVDNTNRQGTASVNDVEWKVKSQDGSLISAGELATVTDIEGVRLVVKK